MKTLTSLLLVFFCLTLTYAQVGINTTSPNALLEVRSSSETNPSNTDGFLLPRMDNFPATNPTAAQDGMLVYLTGNGTPSKGVYSWDSTRTSWGVTSGTISELEKISEGGNTGWRLTGRNPNNHGNIGEGAVDFSLSTEMSFLNGAIGDFSLVAGRNNSTLGDFSIVGGLDNTVSGPFSLVSGRHNMVSGDFSFSSGKDNINNGLLSFSTGTENRSEGAGSFTSGANNISNGSFSQALGVGLISNSFAEIALGMFNTDVAGNNSGPINSDRLLTVGNGSNDTNRSDALVILKNGKITAPSLDISEITDNKDLVTKEYADTNYVGNSEGLEELDEGNGIGWRLVGRDPVLYGNIGDGAVDFSFSNAASTTRGATGLRSFTVGGRTTASGTNAFASGTLAEAAGLSAHALGRQITASSVGEIALGMNGTIVTGDDTQHIGTDRILSVANGVDVFNRSEAFIILKNGTITAPSFDIAEITDNKALVTKEYIDNVTNNPPPSPIIARLVNGYVRGNRIARGPGFYKKDYRVYLEGFYKKITPFRPGEIMFILPAGYRPSEPVRLFGAHGHKHNISFEVRTNGEVYLRQVETNFEFFSLEGLSFRIDNL